MIERKELEAVGRSIGFDAGQAEKDYLQHLVLSRIAKRVGKELVFKGGTALQKTFGLPRYSEDLDFTKNGELDVQALLEAVAADLGKEYPVRIERLRGIGENFRLLVQGPLSRSPRGMAASIRVEVSLRNDLLRPPVVRTVVPPYSGLLPYTLLTMDPEEILAEKVRALLSRKKARDLYDLWFLLRKGVRFERGLVERKAAVTDAAFSARAFKERVDALQGQWKDELRQLTEFLPEFVEVEKSVLETVR